MGIKLVISYKVKIVNFFLRHQATYLTIFILKGHYVHKTHIPKQNDSPFQYHWFNISYGNQTGSFIQSKNCEFLFYDIKLVGKQLLSSKEHYL